jgi:alpha-1,4-digalacturonate transport system permease protein
MDKKKIALYAVALFFSIFFLLPVVYIILNAFKTSAELYTAEPTFFPKVWTLENFVDAIRRGSFEIYIMNSFFVAIVSTVFMVIMNTMAGYALAKYKFKGSTFIMMLILSTIMLPLEVIMVPIFDVLKITGLYNSLWALIIPPAAAPTGMFIMRQYLLTIPDEIMQSARIDGAGEWRIFTRIILPNAKPAIATLGIFSFMWRWNDYVWPLIAISDPKKYTLQLAISNFSGEYSVDWNSMLAMSAISMVPMLIIFLIFQRQFVQGTATSGMKG